MWPRSLFLIIKLPIDLGVKCRIISRPLYYPTHPPNNNSLVGLVVTMIVLFDEQEEQMHKDSEGSFSPFPFR